jgi:hypothetical protein
MYVGGPRRSRAPQMGLTEHAAVQTRKNIRTTHLIPSRLHSYNFVDFVVGLRYLWGSRRPLHPQSGLEPPPQLALLAPAPVLPQGGSPPRRRLVLFLNATWSHITRSRGALLDKPPNEPRALTIGAFVHRLGSVIRAGLQ